MRRPHFLLRRPFAALVLAIGAALAFSTMSVGTASAAPAADRGGPSNVASKAPVRYYGAISMAADGATGVSYDYRTKNAAFKRSQRGCKSRSGYPQTCTKIVWVSNGCAAVSAKFNSQGFVKRYKWASRARTAAAAKAAARRNFGGKIVGWTCTTR